MAARAPSSHGAWASTGCGDFSTLLPSLLTLKGSFTQVSGLGEDMKVHKSQLERDQEAAQAAQVARKKAGVNPLTPFPHKVSIILSCSLQAFEQQMGQPEMIVCLLCNFIWKVALSVRSDGTCNDASQMCYLTFFPPHRLGARRRLVQQYMQHLVGTPWETCPSTRVLWRRQKRRPANLVPACQSAPLLGPPSTGMLSTSS